MTATVAGTRALSPRWLLAAAVALALTPSCTAIQRERDRRERLGRYQENAQRWYDSGQLARAETMARRALEIDPDDFKSNLLLGYVALRTPGGDAREELALSSFERARRARDDYRVSLGLALAHQREAARLRAAGGPDPDTAARRAGEHLDQAEAYFRTTLRRIPDYPRALAGLGQVLALQGEYDEAIEVLSKTVAYATQSQEGFRKLQENAETIEGNRLLEERLEGAATQEVELRGLLANLLFKQGRYAEAVAQLDRVLEAAPERTVEYLNRARCHLELGDAASARADAEAFLGNSELGMDSPLVREALRIRTQAEAADAGEAAGRGEAAGGGAALAGTSR